MVYKEFLRRAYSLILNTHSHRVYKDTHVHVDCKLCGEPVGKSGIYYIPTGSYKCFQPNCEMHSEGSWHKVSSYLRKWFLSEDQSLIKVLQDYEPADVEVEELFDVKVLTSRKLEIPSHIVSLPKGAKPIWLGSKGLLRKKALAYLESRGITLDTAKESILHYGADVGEEYFGYIIAPVFNKNMELVYYNGRDYLNRGKKYKHKNPSFEELHIGKSKVLYNLHRLYEHEVAFLCEGVYDAIEMSKQVQVAGFEDSIGCAGLGINYSPYQINLIKRSGVKKVYICTDVGTYEEVLEIAYSFLISSDIQIYPMCLDLLVERLYEADKGVGKDPDEIGKEAICNFASEIMPMTLDSYFMEKMNLVYYYDESGNKRSKKGS